MCALPKIREEGIGFLYLLELEVQAVVNHLIGVMGIKLRSSVRVTHTLNH